MTGRAAPITVAVPVFAGLQDLQRCLESVLQHASTSAIAFDLLIIDDASPEPEVREYVKSFRSDVARVRVSVLHNEENLGFVRTCNRAFAESSGDVVLLNSDTVVTEGWLDALATAAAASDIATATPLTNFGSICTLPQRVIDAFALDGPAPQIDACAAFVRGHSPVRRPEVITGVGFCMYVTRAALDAVGHFDDETFGHGYGEEVDFCLRATRAGFRHVVDDATFVYHRGGVSFNERRQILLKSSSELIHKRYPFFRTMNARERAEDPLRVSFAALELGLRDRRQDRPHVLQVLHSKPGELGGTEKHFWRLMESLVDEFDVSVFQPGESGFLVTTMWNDGANAPIRHEFLLPGGPAQQRDVDDPVAAAALQTALDMYDFDAVHIQNIFHHSLAPLAVLADFPGSVSCSVRDMYLACPHHWLLYRNTQSCGIPEDLSYCARCLPETRGFDLDHLETFRRTVASRLGTVDHWVFATQSAVDFFRRVYEPDSDRITIIEHGTVIDAERSVRAVDEARIFDEPLRVAFVGIGWAKKGLPEVNRLADALAGTSVELHHFGELREPISPLIHVHGRYDNNWLPELLDRAGIQVVLLPGPFIETFGHVLTEAMIGGLPVIGSKWGALGERIRRHQVGWTIDPEDVESMRLLIEHLDHCRLEVLRATRRAADLDLRSVAATAEQYAALYRTDRGRTNGRRAQGAAGTMTEHERLQRELRAMANVNQQLQAQLAEARKRPAPPAAATRSEAAAPRGSQVKKGARAVARKGRAQVKRVQSAVARRGVVGAGKAGARKVARGFRDVTRGNA
jgi:GT2 family glycosyltransferase/glycosyltransferase involved in cell wall biosynthesis